MIVEDHVLFREMMRTVCQRDFGYEVVAETGEGADALRLARDIEPDVVILDLQLPDADGLDVAEQVMQLRPRCRILIVSSRCDDYTFHRVERVGVHGFVDKNSNTPETLGAALKLVADGKCFYSRLFQDAKLARRRDPENFEAKLTEWERHILSHIGYALTDDEIGARLGISPKTVMTHRSRIMRKLGVGGTPKLIRYAIEHGFTQISPPKVGAGLGGRA